MKKIYWIAAVLLVVGLIAAQCGAAPTEAPKQEAASSSSQAPSSEASKSAESAPASEAAPSSEAAVSSEAPQSSESAPAAESASSAESAAPAEKAKPTGVTLRLIDTSETHGLAFQKLAQPYEEKTGTKVEVEILPYDQVYEKEVLMFSTGGSDYDLVASDCIWVTQYESNGWFLDLTPYTNDPNMPKLDEASFIPGIFNAYDRIGDKLYAIPVDFTTPIMVYRTDLFQEAGLSGPPKTWTEFADDAKKLTKDTNGDGTPDVYGWLWHGGIPDSAYTDWFLRFSGDKLPAGQVEQMFDKDVKKSLFNEGGKGAKGIQMLLDIKQYAPAGSSGFGYGEATQAFAQGQAAMWISWQSMFSDLNDPSKSKVAGKIAFAAPPTDEEKNYYIGGWQLGINAKSKNPDEAYKFLAWIGSDEGQQAMIGAGLTTPYKVAVFNDPEQLKKNPIFVATKEVTEGDHIMPLPKTTHFVEMQQILFEQLQAAFTGVKTPQDAMDLAAKEVDELFQK